MSKLSKAERYALQNCGWIPMAGGWRFLFGGSVKLAHQLSEKGWLDRYGLTDLGTKMRDGLGENRSAHLLPRIEPEMLEPAQ